MISYMYIPQGLVENGSRPSKGAGHRKDLGVRVDEFEMAILKCSRTGEKKLKEGIIVLGPDDQRSVA